MAVNVINHPLVKSKLGILRNIETPTAEFRRVANELACLLTYAATADFPLENKIVQGWAGPVEVQTIQGKEITVAPVLRAGLGLMDGVLNVLPSAKISVIGLYRNEKTLEPVEYYVKLTPGVADRMAIILDPMLATGGSLIAAIDILKSQGCRHICSLNLVCAQEGIDKVAKRHPDVAIYTAAIDQKLDERGYIVPGLGDAGDRIFGTL